MSFKKVQKLLSVNADTKTMKGLKENVLTGILYLAPANISGYQVCPKASEGCKAACLYISGHGRYKNVQNSRINKTKWFFEDRKGFLDKLVEDVAKLERKAKREGMIPAVRLNGTSDIAWEKFRVLYNGKAYRNIMEAFPNVQFYDYTKILGREKALKTSNYNLTFSLSESNDVEALKALDQGYNLAVVMKLKRKDKKPERWSGYPVIDGDVNDIRFNEKHGNIIALFPKGNAIYDKSGFVRNVNESLI
jgi:hypothetical protein